jgi:hypothetical protein
VLAPAEALLLGGGDDLAVDDDGGGGVVEDGVDAQDAHDRALPGKRRGRAPERSREALLCQ